MERFDKRLLPQNSKRIMNRYEMEGQAGPSLSYTQSHSHFSEENSRQLTSSSPSVVIQYSDSKQVKKNGRSKFQNMAKLSKDYNKGQLPGYSSGSSDMACNKVKRGPPFYFSNRVYCIKEMPTILPQKVSTKEVDQDKESFCRFGSTNDHSLQPYHFSNSVRTRNSCSRKGHPTILGMTFPVKPATPKAKAKAKNLMGDTSFPVDNESEYDHLSPLPEDNRRMSTLHTSAEISTNSLVVDHSDESGYEHLCNPLSSEQMEKRTVSILHSPASSSFTEKRPPVSLRLKEKSHGIADRGSASSIVSAGATGYNVQRNKKKLPPLVSRKPWHLQYLKNQRRESNNSPLTKETAVSHSSMQLTDESSLLPKPSYIDNHVHQPDDVLSKHQKLEAVAGNSFPMRKHIGLETTRSRLPALWRTDLEVPSIEERPPTHLPLSHFAVKTCHKSKDNMSFRKNENPASNTLTHPSLPFIKSSKGHMPEESPGKTPCATIFSKFFNV